MPTYVYRCDACAHQFDLMQRFADDPIDICPACGSTVRRVFQPVGVVFKGSGWYINDSRPSSTTNGNASNGTSTEDAKPAATADAKSDKTTSDTSKTEKPKATPAAAPANPAKTAAAS